MASAIVDNYLSFIRRLVPEPARRPAVGLDIGRAYCKLVEVTRDGGGITLTRWAMEPVNGDPSAAVKNVLAKASLPSISPMTSLYGQGTLIRYIDLPKMSLEDLKKSFAFEADKYFPFPADQIFVDCDILDLEAKDNRMNVLVAAAKKDLVDERLRLLNGLGLSPEAVTLNSVAVANAFAVLGESSEGNDAKAVRVTAVFDMGELVSNLTILVGGAPRFTRDIFMGGRDLTRSISNALACGLPEAEQLKRDPGAQGEAVANAAMSVILNMISELRLSFDYFMTERNVPISSLALTGGTSMFQGLPAIFEKYLEIPVSLWNPFSRLKIAEGLSAEEVHKHAGPLGVSLGLALSVE